MHLIHFFVVSLCIENKEGLIKQKRKYIMVEDRKTAWKFNGTIYSTRQDITKKFGWSTCVWNAKRRDGEITKVRIN